MRKQSKYIYIAAIKTTSTIIDEFDQNLEYNLQRILFK